MSLEKESINSQNKEREFYPINPILRHILNLDGFICFISGFKGSGKTNFAMLLAEICHIFHYRQLFASNIHCESYYIEEISNYHVLKEWLEKRKGKKLYILDEAGKNLKRLRFMTEVNVALMDLIQLIRHYDCGLIGIAPSERFIDSNFTNTDILDVHIKKISMKEARMVDYAFTHESYFLDEIPKSSIIHDSKSIAPFSMERIVKVDNLQKCCQVAYYYKRSKSLIIAGKSLNPPLEPMEVRRLIFKHLEHCEINT